MSRPLRINYPGAWYHVHHKSLAHQTLFPDKQHQTIFFSLIQDICDIYRIEIHAWCLLECEFHLLIRTPEPRLSEAMRHLLGQYTSRYNRLHQHEGPIFKSRYKSVLIENDVHVVQASRHIHRLPKEIALARGQNIFCISTWRWSSYRAYIAKVRPAPWLDTQQVLHYFAQQNGKALYQIYVETGEDLEIDSFYGKNRISPVMGSGNFKRRLSLKQYFDTDEVPDAKLLLARPAIDEIIQKVCGFFSVQQKDLLTSRRGRGQKNLPRSIAIALCRSTGGYSLKEIAKVFGVSHYSSISVAIRRLQNSFLEDDKIKHDYEVLRSKIAL